LHRGRGTGNTVARQKSRSRVNCRRKSTWMWRPTAEKTPQTDHTRKSHNWCRWPRKERQVQDISKRKAPEHVRASRVASAVEPPQFPEWPPADIRPHKIPGQRIGQKQSEGQKREEHSTE